MTKSAKEDLLNMLSSGRDNRIMAIGLFNNYIKVYPSEKKFIKIFNKELKKPISQMFTSNKKAR